MAFFSDFDCLERLDRSAVVDLKRNQGLHECEVFGSWPDKVESTFAWDNCTKTQNKHTNFFSVHQFCEENIPSRYPFRKSMVGYIKHFASLVVRLRINFVSEGRPDGYSFAKCRGSHTLHLGTGWIYRVRPGDGLCPCSPPCHNKFLRPDWWSVEIFTACHVVYDKQEAQWTSVDLYYDDENSPKLTLFGYGVSTTDTLNDVCILQCCTHNPDLCLSFKNALSVCQLQKSLMKNMTNSQLCVVISHPHGMSKKITVGEIVGKSNGDLELFERTEAGDTHRADTSESSRTADPTIPLQTECMYSYTADTCPGSSGAPVLCYENDPFLSSPNLMYLWPGAGPHSMGDVELGLNMCGAGAFFVKSQMYVHVGMWVA